MTNRKLLEDERPFTCEVCSKKFRHTSNLYEHRSVHTGFAPFACPYCGKTCRLKGNLKKHMKIHVTNREELEAAWAPFARHPRPYSPTEGSNSTGEQSRTSSVELETREEMTQRVSEERRDQWTMMLRSGEAMAPVEMIEREHDMFDAINCSRNVREMFDIAKAIVFENHRCSKCTFAFKSLEDLNTHLANAHEILETDRFRCEMCSRSFSHRGNLDQHLSYHRKVKEFFELGWIENSEPQILIPSDEDMEHVFANEFPVAQ